MSRIVGLWSAEGEQAGSGHFRRMLAATPLGNDWRKDEVRAGSCHLGWSGWRTPNIASAPDGTVAVMDGFLYNRDDLGGGSFANDAGLFLSIFAREGMEGALVRVNGDFAVAVYQPAQNTLWLATDRFRVKPLYYTRTPSHFAFASQPRSLLVLPISREPNRQFVGLFAGSHYRTIDNAIDQSPYAAISSLPPASWLRWASGSVTTQMYWRLAERGDLTEPETEVAERYRDLLLDAVRIRLAAAERAAFTLSGGMDSSSVLASAVHLLGSKQHAFSSVYVDRTYDESNEIRTMIEPAVAQWHEIVVDVPDVYDLVRKMVAVHDEPVATATWLSHFVLCEETHKSGFGSLFGGLGSDELNAGEYEHFWYFFADLQVEGHSGRLADEVEGWVRYHDHPIFRKSFSIMQETLPRVVDLSLPGRCLPDRARIDRYADAVRRDYFDVRAFEPVMETPFRSYLKNRTYQDLTRETDPCCLRAEDRQTAAFKLDNFLPFMDYRLAELMFRVPGTLKFDRGVTKRLLREAMKGILPEETRTRTKKTGWNAPAHLWFSGRGKEPLLDMIRSRTFQERGIYDVKEVERLVWEHDAIVTQQQNRDNHMMFFWQLVNLQTWLDTLDTYGTVSQEAAPQSS